MHCSFMQEIGSGVRNVCQWKHAWPDCTLPVIQSSVPLAPVCYRSASCSCMLSASGPDTRLVAHSYMQVCTSLRPMFIMVYFLSCNELFILTALTTCKPDFLPHVDSSAHVQACRDLL